MTTTTINACAQAKQIAIAKAVRTSTPKRLPKPALKSVKTANQHDERTTDIIGEAMAGLAMAGVMITALVGFAS